MNLIGRRPLLLAAGAALLPGATRAAIGAEASRPAPDFTGITHWLNTPPLTMAQLRGKVVLVDFWTYSCINCLRTLPYLKRWYEAYHDRGLVIVGVHTPEFPFERDTANVEAAIKRFGIPYPVAQDNGYGTWKAYDNQYWPAEYLVDRQGRIVMQHFGEGHYAETEQAIRTLLDAGPAPRADAKADAPDAALAQIGSPEMYFGLARVAQLASPEPPRAGEADYTAPATLPRNRFALEGRWSLSPDKATLARAGGGIRLAFDAGRAFMVASSPEPVDVAVTVDGKPQPPVRVRESRLYTLYDGGDYGEHTLSLSIPKAGFEAFTFTFG